jgi:peptide/nickel transport system substrate-binding protein
MKVGQTFLANAINPIDGSTGWALTSHGIAEKLFTVDSTGTVVPQIAQSVSKINTFTWEVTLKSNYKFSDGTVVTATHVADCLTLLNTNNSNARATLGSMTMSVISSTQVRILSENASPVMDAVLANWVFTIFLQQSGGTYIFTGPYAVETFVASSHLNLIPNTYYTDASERLLVSIHKYADGFSLATPFAAGNLDMAFHLAVQNLSSLRQINGLAIKSFPVSYQYMMWHNMRRSPLSDVNVRKAIDIALDRSEMTQELLGGDATRSFFPPNTPYALQNSQLGDLHADRTAAEALLDQAGWVMDGNLRKKAGVTLTLKLVAYPQRPGLVTMQPVIKRTLEALGITVNDVVTNGANWAELDAIIAAKDFDLLMWAQNTLPAGDPQWFTNNFFHSTSGSNYAGLDSTSVDNLIDALSTAEEPTRVTVSGNAQKAILDLAPVSILCAPDWHVGVGSRLAHYQPYGADYYIVNPYFGIPSPSTTPFSTTTAGNVISDDNTNGSYRMMVSVLLVTSLLLFGTIFWA